MSRIAFFAYATVSYAIFFGTFLYTAGFLTNLFVPKSIDRPAPGGDISGIATAVGMNLLLLSLFAIQHSGMARPAFKRAWTRIVPEPIERATYVLFSSLVLIAVMALWQPMPGLVWHFESGLGRAIGLGLFGLGLGTVLYATMLIDHFELFGLRPCLEVLMRRPARDDDFVTPSLYRYVRHPLYVGWLITLWATPSMTYGHLLFSAVCTAYIGVAVQLEERDLVAAFGRRYREYQESTPMFVPGTRRPASRMASSTAV